MCCSKKPRMGWQSYFHRMGFYFYYSDISGYFRTVICRVSILSFCLSVSTLYLLWCSVFLVGAVLSELSSWTVICSIYPRLTELTCSISFLLVC